jgi:hypothetical protein
MPTKSRKNDDGRFVLISRAKLIALFDNAVRSRMLEELLPHGAAGKTRWASAAAAVSACIDLGADDLLTAHGHDSLPAFVAGQSIARVLAARNRPAAAERLRFEKRLKSALTAARRHRKNGNGKVVVVFRGTATERAWKALLDAAQAESLPMMLVANGELDKAVGEGAPAGMPAMIVDRDDVVAIYRIVAEGLAHARRGNGPTLIECIPWNLEGRVEPSDTVAVLEAYLTKKGILAARRRVKVAAEFAPKLARQRSSKR